MKTSSGRREIKKPTIAIIGSGAAGMAAGYLLQHTHEVTIFESASRLGGHACAVPVKDSSGTCFELDVAFLIFNDRTYENFNRWLDLLGVSGHSMSAEMSSCFSDPVTNLHYTLGRGIAPIFHQKRNLFRPRFWRMFRDLKAFRQRAYEDITTGSDLSGITVGEYLKPYGPELRDNFVLPLTSAIWSLGSGSMLEYPVDSILNYFYNHQLLRGKSEKRWRTFRGASGVYVRAFEKAFRGEIRLSCPVKKIDRHDNSVSIHSFRGEERFDHVVLATHADVSLKLLASPSESEKRLLGAWRYQDNPAVLHQDISILHPAPQLWASWNMRRETSGSHAISYWLNRAQSLPTNENFILSLGNPILDESLVLNRFSFRHPVFSVSSVATQPELSTLNGQNRTYFCGSYFGHGFHEDAVTSGVKVANMFGVDWPLEA